MTAPHPDPLVLDGIELSSRLIMGTGGLSSLHTLEQALLASGTELTTVALRRYAPGQGDSLFALLERNDIRILPNTAGCYTARDALLTAEQVSLIDLDQAGHGPAAADIGSLLARLHHGALLGESTGVDADDLVLLAQELLDDVTTDEPG